VQRCRHKELIFLRHKQRRCAPCKLNCHQTVTKIGAEQAKISELQKTEMLLTDGWQRDLVDFCIR
jgi:hypothetical protein